MPSFQGKIMTNASLQKRKIKILVAALALLFVVLVFWFGQSMIVNINYAGKISDIVVHDNSTVCANHEGEKVFFSWLDEPPKMQAFMAENLCAGLDIRESEDNLLYRISEKFIIWKIFLTE